MLFKMNRIYVNESNQMKKKQKNTLSILHEDEKISEKEWWKKGKTSKDANVFDSFSLIHA